MEEEADVDYQWLIPILAFLSVTATGGAFLTAIASRRKTVQARLGTQQTSPSTGRDRGKHTLRHIAETLGNRAQRSSEDTSRLRKRLIQAGFTDPAAPACFLGSKILLLAAGFCAAVPLVLPADLPLSMKLFAITAAAGLPNILPNLIVDHRRRTRRTEVQMHLPDAIDLLEICVSSGMALDAAWNHTAKEMRRVSSLLADEMALTNLEINLGSDRRTAMQHMAERADSQDLAFLVAAIMQSERFGTSIGDALWTYAGSLREQRSQRAREAAEKMSVKMLFPMIAFIFPAIFIVAVGPAVIKIVRMFESI